jgi:hypothetical protein
VRSTRFLNQFASGKVFLLALVPASASALVPASALVSASASALVSASASALVPGPALKYRK